MLLEQNNLIIRNASITDATQLAIWWNDGKIMAHAGFPNGTGQTVATIEDHIKLDTDDTCRRLIIEIDHIPSGEMVYFNKGNGVAEIGIKICDFSKHNQGIGKRLLSMLIFSLFNDMGYNKIILDTDLNNKRAQHVYEQLGFRQLRITENSWCDQLGQLRSSVDYELYKKDFVNYSK